MNSFYTKRLTSSIDFGLTSGHLLFMDIPFSVRSLILLALQSGSAHGAELIQRIGRRSNGEIILSAGSVYPVLRELEREGLIATVEDDSDRKVGRPRTTFRLTSEGLARAHYIMNLPVQLTGQSSSNASSTEKPVAQSEGENAIWSDPTLVKVGG